jgi:hypothetical protein
VQMKIPNLQYGNFRKNLKKCYQVWLILAIYPEDHVDG